MEIFGGLVTLDLDLKVQPDIAESWDISPDGTVYTFHLRDNAVFQQGGRRVTADDFKYSLERAADPANASPTATLYLGAIVGFNERYNNKADDVEGIKVIDEQTLQITIKEPRDWFLSELTYPVAYVVDQQQIESNPRGWTQTPNGTGPFRLQEFTPGEQIVLVRNDRYHLGPAKLDKIDFDLASGSMLTAYQNNEIHIGAVPAIELQGVEDGSASAEQGLSSPARDGDQLHRLQPGTGAVR